MVSVETMLKRIFDIIFAAGALIVLSPVIIIVAVLVRFRLGKPVFFRQERPGLDGRPFTLIKFRTMRDASDENGNPLADSERLTRFGSLLRATSLDELPELYNILRGDMSFVGPRPLLTEYLPLYNARQARRHETRPGLTGWAQINGRNAADWPERLEMDVWYVENQSFLLDLKILLLTIAKVLKQEGISADGEATVARFIGNPDKGDKNG